MTTDDLRTRAEAVAKRVWPDRPDADRITYPHAALQHYRQGAFVQGALWRATQQPSREVEHARDDQFQAGYRAGIAAASKAIDRLVTP